MLCPQRYKEGEVNNATLNIQLEGLDLSKYYKFSKEETVPLYDLYAVVNKYGNFNAGHYNCYVKSYDDNEWYHCNDSDVKIMNDREIKDKIESSNTSYALFYRK